MKRLVMAALLIATPVRAQDGFPTCERWNAATTPPPGQSQSPDRTFSIGLLLDYIEQHSKEPDRDYYAGQIDLHSIMNDDELAAELDSYCTAHPGDSLLPAYDSIFRDLMTEWLTSHPNGR